MKPKSKTKATAESGGEKRLPPAQIIPIKGKPGDSAPLVTVSGYRGKHKQLNGRYQITGARRGELTMKKIR